MSELTDLEKLKKEVENIKRYLKQDVGVLNTIYSDTVGHDWDVCRENLEIYYEILHRVQNDLFDGIDNEYFNTLRENVTDVNKLRQLSKRMRENSKNGIRENRITQQEKITQKQDILLKKGGKTRKNRKSRK